LIGGKPSFEEVGERTVCAFEYEERNSGVFINLFFQCIQTQSPTKESDNIRMISKWFAAESFDLPTGRPYLKAEPIRGAW
jgi:hypothetical protein